MGFEAITLAPAKQDSIEEQVRIVEDLLQKKIPCLDHSSIRLERNCSRG